MGSNLDKFKTDLISLIKLGESMDLDFSLRVLEETGQLSEVKRKLHNKIKGHFEQYYQQWYTESLEVIRQLIPNRVIEFEQLYRGEGKRKVIGNDTYFIQDWLNGIRSAMRPYTTEKIFDDMAIVGMRFKTQLNILKSSNVVFESSLLQIRQFIQADLYDSELESASQLLKHGFLRGAGAIGGVVLEKHLSQVLLNHNIITRKKNPTISDFNDLLKKNDIIDIPIWRQIQRLGDIRNLCDHNKEREPTVDEVDELIKGVEKISKSIF